MRIFKKSLKSSKNGKKEIPEGLWTKCPKCSHLVFNKMLEENMKVCPKCSHHYSLTCWERLSFTVDEGSFVERDSEMASDDPLEFSGPKTYKQKIAEDEKKTGLKSAILTGQAKIEGQDVALAITDSRFIMGSMGSVVGEKITRIAEVALEKKIPLVIISGSGGGARMYEGMLSLMQMAKTCGILSKLKEQNVPFISVLTHPTMAGIMASFAGVGDITVAEPGALIGFTGPRVIKQTIKQDLPKGFQTSEFNLEHGMVDIVVSRKELKQKIAQLMKYLVAAT